MVGLVRAAAQGYKNFVVSDRCLSKGAMHVGATYLLVFVSRWWSGGRYSLKPTKIEMLATCILLADPCSKSSSMSCVLSA